MQLTAIRYSTSPTSTLSALLIDGEFACYLLEDGFNDPKIPGKTRIPSGEYSLSLQRFGRLHGIYQAKFSDIHKGMIKLDNVPGFEGVLLHLGNDAEDTEGCLLPGDNANNNRVSGGWIGSSAIAYRRIYPAIAYAILTEGAWLTIGTPQELLTTNPFNQS